MLSRRSLLFFFALASLILATGDAWAQGTRQERLFAAIPGPATAGSSRLVEIDTSIETFGSILSSTPITVPVSQPLFGGRFLVGASGMHFGVFDTRLRVGYQFPLSGWLFALDTHRPRAFVTDFFQAKVVDLGTGVITMLPFGSRWAPLAPAAYAGAVDRLFIQGLEPTKVNVVDVATGVVVRSIDLGIGPESYHNRVKAMATDSSGSRLFVLIDGVSLAWQVSAFDVATGALIKRVDLRHWSMEPSTVYIPFQALQFDEERDRLLVGTLIVFDASTLERLGSTSGVGTVPYHRDSNPAFSFTGPRSPFIIFSSHISRDPYILGPTRCQTAQLERRNAATGVLEAVADIGVVTGLIGGTPSYQSCPVDMMMVTVPRAPQHVVGTVTGRQVTLSWIDPGNTMHFDIEAGSAPGLANLMSRSVSGTTFTVDHVPSGRYYVRVRAINDVGRSVPTSDVEIIVP